MEKALYSVGTQMLPKQKLTQVKAVMELELLVQHQTEQLEKAKQELTQLEVAKQELTQLEVAKQELTQLEAAKQELTQPETAKQELTQLEAAKQELTQLEAAKQALIQLEAAKQELTRLEAAKQELTQPETAKQELTQLEAAKQELTQLEAAKQALIQLEAAKQELTRLEAAKEELTQPETAIRELTRLEHFQEKLDYHIHAAKKEISTQLEVSQHELTALKAFVGESSLSLIYTYHASIEEPLTKKIRQTMSKNVKTKSYMALLAQSERHFVNNDEHVFNLARDDYTKNVGTARPTRLLQPLANYSKSVGRIVCGNVQGTCFLVTPNLVITNHHIYLDINREINESGNLSLRNQIKVSFDYLYPGQTENITEVEVDGEQLVTHYSPELDYVLLQLKQSLTDRVPLGPMVRNHPLHEGRVTIIGYPQGREQLEETCVVVQHYLWRHKLLERYRVHVPPERVFDPGLYMCKEEIMSPKYAERLPYDTSLFNGASGSPVFDMNGHIIAMHTQNYPLTMNGKSHSIMEFGINFAAICEDMKLRFDVVRDIFPVYDSN